MQGRIITRRNALIGAAATLVSSCAPPGYAIVPIHTDGTKPLTDTPSPKIEIKYVNFQAQVNGDSCAALTSGLLAAVAADVKDIRIFITSSGGDTGQAMQAYEALRNLPADVTTYNTAMVNSAAVILYLAGEKRVATQNTFFQLHYPVVEPNNSNRSWRKEFIAMVGKQMENVYRERTLLSRAQLDMVKQHRHLILSAEAALSARIATEVVPHVAIPPGSSLLSIHSANS